ncbi:MAG: DUF1097 domain-containing protein [Lachnospiraceae bacterium]|nr:DUF1097 domain-containing protein [Lachnospiraceae bacterium]
MKKKEVLSIIVLGFLIGFLPTVWSLLADNFGIKTATVALICAGIYATNGNDLKSAPKILLGFFLGDLWSVITVCSMSGLPISSPLKNFLIFVVLGIVGVMLCTIFSKVLFLPALLVGWAIGLTYYGAPGSEMGTLPFQIALAMAVGVVYVGIGVDFLHKLIIRK